MIYPKLSDGTIDWCVMCKHEGNDFYDLCFECEYPENSDDPPAKYEPKPITNADRIRSMTDEELAELWWERVDCGECPVHRDCRLTGQDCKQLALDWLRQEASNA